MKPLHTPKRYRYFRSFCIIVLVAFAVRFFNSPYGVKYVSSVGFLSAAVVFALQNYIASFISFLYIRSSNQFDIGDIVNTGNPFMSAKGEVIKILPFFTTVKEVGDDLMFTGRTISFPNNLIFTGGVFNYTRKDLYFWHEIQITVGLTGTATETLDAIKNIVLTTYTKTLKDNVHYPENNFLKLHKPKYDTMITDKGLLVKIRILVHFYKVLETNNLINIALIDASRLGLVYIVQHNDYKGLSH